MAHGRHSLIAAAVAAIGLCLMTTQGDVHTNTLEGFFSVLKRGLVGVYQHVDKHHLDRYLAEFDFRQNNREKLGVNDVQRADRALQGVVGKRLTYAGTAEAEAIPF